MNSNFVHHSEMFSGESIAVTRILVEKEVKLQRGNHGRRREPFLVWLNARVRERRVR